ncbi:extracellular solute-binding protein [Microbacterium sp. SD291]|uniref:extracellular solute-binding protein n=1 Tax=Microbacterium sp. SD291 TaxID=2782007 RepID=UPI001A95A988|nr:extracellular solute-binding protein [Microbacterium sp. SD291]MBO0982082.1 extracellular solute-binding protein [Microbacterium sp. SD291]
MKHRSTAVAGIAAAASLLLAGCTGAGGGGGAAGPIDTDGELSGTVQFQTWSLKNEKFTPYFEALIDDFEKENPEVTVDWIDQPGDGYQDKILSQANSDTLPDVLNLPPDIAFPLVQAGKLLDLAAADPDLEAAYNAGGWAAYSGFSGVEGTYGLPWYLGSDLSWWNLEQLAPYDVTKDSLPTTTTDWLELAKTVAADSAGEVQLVSSMPGLDTFIAAEVPVMDEDGTFVFNSPEAVEIVQQYADAYAAGAMPAEALTGSYAGNAEMFLQGKVAYTTGGSGFAGDLRTKAPTLLEQTTATARPGVPPLFVQGINVSADSKNPSAALAFAEFVTNEANQVEFVKLAVGFAPGTAGGTDEVVSSVSADLDPAQAEAMTVMFDALDEAEATPFQWTGAMTDYLNQQMALAIRGDLGAEEALDKIVDYANENRIDQ